MDDDIFDAHEQSERARSLFQRYGSAVLTGVLAAVAVLWGYRGWESSKVREAYSAQIAYADFEKALDSKDESKITQMGAQVRLTHNGTTYAALASMAEAKFLIENGKPEKAEPVLQYAITNAKIPELQDLAKLRLARFYVAKDRAQDALNLAQAITNPGYAAQKEEVRGDALLALKKTDEARAAFAAALTATDLADAHRNTLQQKLDNLTVGTP